MKKLIISVLLLQLKALLISQNTWWVSNRNDGIEVDFTSLQTAYDAASPGDTLIVYPSPYIYHGLNITKEIHLKGLGFHSDTISQPSLEIASFSQPTKCYGQVFNSGSDGSTIESFQIVGGIQFHNTSECIAEKCEVESSILFYNSTNIQILNCYIHPHGPPHNSHFRFYNSPNNIVSNCIIPPSGYASAYSDNTSINNILLNNILHHAPEMYNAGLFNNIIISGICAGEMNIVENNIHLSGTPGVDGNNNQYGASNVFVGYPIQGSYSFDSRWQLSPGSPAIGAGVNNEDCGVFGGQYPYKLSGVLNRPLIYELSAPELLLEGDDLPVTIKVRAEN